MPRPEARNVKCWAMSVDSSHTPTGSPSARQSSKRSAERPPLQSTSAKAKRRLPSSRDDSDSQSACTAKTVVRRRPDENSNQPRQVDSFLSRVDSPLQTHRQNDENYEHLRPEHPSVIRDISPFALDNPAEEPCSSLRTSCAKRELAHQLRASRQRLTSRSTSSLSIDRLRSWREEPEKLSEREKDDVQLRIQETYREALVEKPKPREELLCSENFCEESEEETSFEE